MKFTITLWEKRNREPATVTALTDSRTLMQQGALSHEAICEAFAADNTNMDRYLDRLEAALDRDITVKSYLKSLVSASRSGRIPRIEDRRPQQQPNSNGNSQQHTQNNGGNNNSNNQQKSNNQPSR